MPTEMPDDDNHFADLYGSWSPTENNQPGNNKGNSISSDLPLRERRKQSDVQFQPLNINIPTSTIELKSGESPKNVDIETKAKRRRSVRVSLTQAAEARRLLTDNESVVQTLEIEDLIKTEIPDNVDEIDDPITFFNLSMLILLTVKFCLGEFVEEGNPKEMIGDLEAIAEGMSGEVFAGEWLEAQLMVACKVVPFTAKEKLSILQNEVSMMRKCHHENIVEYFTTFANADSIWVSFYFLQRPECNRVDHYGVYGCWLIDGFPIGRSE